MRRGLVVLAAVAATSLAACGGGQPLAPQAKPSGFDPRPVGVQDPAELPDDEPGGGGSCDPLASYRPAGDGTAVPSGSTMDEIVERGRLVVGVSQNTYLFGYRDPFTGELTGFDIDIAREVARALLGDPDRIQFRAISSADRIPMLQDGRVDLVVRTMTMNCQRWEEVAFSTEYYSAGQRVLVHSGSEATGIEDLGGQKVCAAAGSTSIRNVAAADSEPVPVSVADWTDCLVLLQQGQVAAVSTDDTILAGLAAQDPNTRVVGETFTEEPYGIAANSDHVDLVRFVNAVLERLRSDGTWSEIYDRWLADPLGAGAQPPPARYRD
jgi:polar amino acid transport system substrate-binding protein